MPLLHGKLRSTSGRLRQPSGTVVVEEEEAVDAPFPSPLSARPAKLTAQCEHTVP